MTPKPENGTGSSQPPPEPSGWRNRIVGEGKESPGALVANERNWRLHPREQQDVMRGVLDEVGWCQRVIVNKRTGRIVDGHLRVSVAVERGEATVPVLYVDLSEEEEKKILLTFDPLGGMATMDEAKFRELVADVEFGSAEVKAAMDKVSTDAGITRPEFQPVGIDEQGRLDQKTPVTCPKCGHEFTT